MEVILDRKANPPARSYTAELFRGGVARITGKILEEAEEVVEAAAEPGSSGRTHLVGEVADLVYHLLVLLAAVDAHWCDVEHVLSQRFGMSGLDEKESRGR
jgi:phosphoribosyl-ATP pyrophosphohydrolase